MEPAIYHALVQEEERARQTEEERMTRYTSEDLQNDWEFKIVRTTGERFRNPRTLQQLLDEEAASGWELLEKLDDNRVRFKRPLSARRKDDLLPTGVDPYRTQFGSSLGSARQRIWVLSLSIGAMLVAGIVLYFLMFILR